jgi:hypothetical protein
MPEIIKDSILIGYVCGSSVDPEFMPSVFNFMNYDSDIRHGGRRSVLGLFNEPGSFVDDNRNKLTRKMLTTPAEYFLLLDTDTIISPPAPYLLLDVAKARNCKIVVGLQFSFLTDGGLLPIWYDGVADNGEVRQVGKIEFGTTQPLVAAGLGCALIHREVFEAFLKVPKWRNDSWTWFGRDQYGPVGDTAHLGEDVTFCLRAKELGFEMLGHAGVEARHAKRWVVGFEEFKILYQANYKGVRGDA